MVNILKKKNMYCTGCAACFNVCSSNAIDMQKDIYGFEKAVINKDKCVNCHLCEKVCPVLNDALHQNHEKPTSYAAWAEDEVRKNSAAGGAFSLIAKSVLNKGGVVYGAAFKNATDVYHTSASNETELLSLQKSKYVQSHIGLTYRNIKEHLKKGTPVLFAGCPCQVAGLKAYLQNDFSKLITIDLVCAGVPSSQMLQDSLEDVGGVQNVEKIDFRDKTLGWDCSQLTVYTKDGRKRVLPMHKVPWEKQSQFEVAMHQYLAKNDACENCKFCDFPRQGDVTIGDYWGIWTKDESWNDHKGTSMILVNSDKGEEIFKEIKEQFKRVEQVPWKEYAHNRLQPKATFNSNRQRFLTLYPSKPFNRAVEEAMSGRHDIGLIGNWNGNNYGSELTHYALYEVLNSWGYSVLMIGPPGYAEWKSTNDLMFRQRPYPDWDMSEVAQSPEEMRRLNRYCDKFVLGADQLFDGFLYEKLGAFSSLDWVSDSKIKISYATSFGYDELRGSEAIIAQMGYGIGKFDALSVREKSGVKIMKEVFGRDAYCALEPVFLPEKSVYEKLIENASVNTPLKPYLLVYLLDISLYGVQYARMLAEQYNLEIVFIKDAAKKHAYVSETMGCAAKENVSVEDWLWYIKNSAMVLTDSFHACCFSILFERQFITLCNYGRGSARFTSLLQKLNLMEYLVIGNTKLPENEEIPIIDYKKVNHILIEWKNESFEWLKNALEPISQKAKVESSHFLLEERLLRNEELMQRMQKELEEVRREMKHRNIVRGGIQCLKDNGILYTIKRVGQKGKDKLR